MSLILPRRSFLAGLASALAAPAIVRASSLMPVKVFETGEVLTVTQGVWTGVPLGFTFQWMASVDGKNFVPIEWATYQTLDLADWHAGQYHQLVIGND